MKRKLTLTQQIFKWLWISDFDDQGSAKPIKWNPLLLIVTIILATIVGVIAFFRHIYVVFKEVYR